MTDSNAKTGIVYLVGTGPGDPELVSLKAVRLLDLCDVVVYDNLVPDELIITLPRSVERHYVGKRAGTHALTQDEINALLVTLAQQGKTVVRFKGGDPFVFGRGAEEAQYLKDHGVPFVVVPGMTAGITAPASVGIPCTDRRRSAWVMLATGHKASAPGFAEVPWDWVGQAKEGTLIIYMGVSEIENIVSRLITSGLSPDTPAAVIERGGFPTQRVFRSSLAGMPDTVKHERVHPPAVFVIGNTVDLHEHLAQPVRLPLFGARILVTRPVSQSRELYRTLRELGAEVQPFATIKTERVHDSDGWTQLGSSPATNKWIVFNNENGVRHFLDQWLELHPDIRTLNDCRIVTVGRRAERVLRSRHLVPDLAFGATMDANIADEMATVNAGSSHVVWVCGNRRDTVGEQKLTEAGYTVMPLQVYRTVPIEWGEEIKAKLMSFPPNVVLFSSGASVASLADNLTDDERAQIIGRAAIVSIGPATSRAVRSRGWDVTVEAKRFSLDGTIDELIQYWSTHLPELSVVEPSVSVVPITH